MRRPLFLVCLCLVVMAGLRFGDTDRTGPDGQSCIVTGQIYQKDTDYFYLKSVFLKQEAASQQQTIPFTENLICEYDEETPVLIGSTVRVLGTFCTFDEATNPGGFDGKSYYRSLNIGGKLEEVTILEASEEYSRWREILFELREYFRGRLYKIFPQKEASVMCAMLLGDKSELDKEVKELYQSNGIVHILSISGLHITIIGMSIYRMLRRMGMPVWMAALCGGGILLLYGVMTGMSVSACRAIGMYLLRILSEVVGRTYDMLTALGIMAAIVVWSNPGYLMNAGFYLSFGAVLGIGVLCPALMPEQEKKVALKYEERRWKQVADKIWGKVKSGLCQSMLSGLSVTLMTLPIQLWFYYEVPTYSIFINLLVVPFVSAVMVCGLLAMLVPGLGILGTVDCLILGGYELLCNLFEKLPFHTWNPGRPQVWQMMAYYILVLGVVAVRHKFIPKRLLTGVGLTVAVILIILPIPKGTTITFLDVGQGDCICMQTASGQVYLFDCGSSSRRQVGEYVLKPYLKYMGIRHIDGVFVSHFDSDHYNGVQELLASGEEWGITVGEVILPGDIGAGVAWSIGGIRFTCLHPPAEAANASDGDIADAIADSNADSIAGAITDSNADSQCFYIEMPGNFSLLLTGDVEAEGEEQLLQELKVRGIQDVTILKVAHHGSKYSSKEELLEQINPAVAVISCGKRNSYGHPHEETLERFEAVGSTILTTPDCGAIIVECGQKVTVRSWLQTD